MNKRDIHTAINTGGLKPGGWLFLLQWLRLLVLSLARINHYKPDKAYYKPIQSPQNHIQAENPTKTQTLTTTKLTNMNPAHKYLKWSVLLLFAFLAKFASAQVGPFPLTGNDNVCVGQTKNYGVTKVTGSTYSWTITPGTEGVDWILTVTDNTITVKWLKAGTYTVSVAETNADNCTGDAVQITVTVHDLPVCSITGPDNICPGSTNIYNAPSGMTTYSWSISGDATISGANNGQTVSVIADNKCGSYTLTLVITNEFGCSSTCTQTFNITAPPVVLNPPKDTVVSSCLTQAQVDAAFADWLARVSSSGGCTLVVTNDATAAPPACGGSVTVTWTAKSPCEADVVKSATFTVTKPTPVVVTAAAATTVNACDYTDQAALNAAFQTWLGTASVSGGCAPVPSNGNPTAPDLCQGGTVTVTFTATDKCETQSATATFTVTKPTPVVVTAAAATTVNACDYTDQAALNAAFQTWLGTASVSGGCAPVPSNGNPTAPDLCQGGTVTVTFTATDKCETQSATATFTVTKPTPVVVTAAAATTVNACDYTDQAALNAAFQTWLGTASVSGGCAPVPSNGNPTAPDLCQGGTVTVTFTATDKCETQSATATFTVTKPTPVVVTAAAATTVNACDYTDQAALNAAFQTWLGTASVSGGCAPVPSNGNPTAPDLCQGGTVTVTFTATDKCETQSATATFTVTKPTPVVVTAAAATTVNACDYTDQAALNAAFQTWLGTASVSGGCAPVPSNGNPTAPDLCQGGTVTVTFTATDKCETQSATATFTVTKPTPVVVTAAAATTVNACDYTDQAALNAAFQTWLGTASVSGGCAPVPSNGNPTAPDLCQGGTVTVTFTATDKCETQSATATFTVTKPTPVVVTAAAATTVNACDYTDQAALNAAFQTWLGTASVSGGCAPVPSNGNPTAPDLCQGGTVTVTFTATDKCETQSATATFTVTKPTPVVVTAAAATTVNACDYTDQAALNAAFQTWLGTASVSGGCAPVPSNGNPTAPDLCQGGTVTVTFTATDKCETQSATATFTVTKPTPVVVTAAAATTVNACDYTDQAALNAAFQTWLGTASVSGGCAPVPSNGNPTAPDLCQGGTVTVTFTATDKCETQSATATFTVTKPTPVVVTAAAATTVNACDYTDQAALNAAFQTWLGTASVSGGCAPVPSNGNPTAPDLCQGGTVTVTFTATDKCETQSATATFTVTKPTPVVVTAAAATTVNACDYTDQAALNAAFQTWLGTASVSGGCAPVPSNGNPTAPDLCQGGTVTVTFTATDKCETQSATATFTVTKPTPVVVTAAAATTVNACDYTDQAALNAAFQTWLGTASVSGGCAPVPSNGNPTAPDLCQGGTVTVTFTATDKCETQSATATFTVTKPTPVVVTAAAATTVNACDYTDQAALNAAFQTWLGTASVSGGCAPVPSNGNPTAPDLCQGGTVTVTFTATDKCETQSATATFTVTKPTPVVVTAAAATTVNACDYTDQAALNAAFQTWLGTASVSGGCAPVPSNGNPTAPDLCQGGTVTVTFTATDKCETQSATATFTVTKPTPVVVTAAAATTVNACDYTDQAALNAAFQTWLGTASVSGGCAPVPSNGNPTAPDLCQGGTVTVTFTATDKCETQSATATFTVTKPTPVVVTAAAATTVNACDYTDQAALNAAFQTWLGTASVSGGCAPVPSNGNPTAPDLCQGGTVTVTFTATDKCETQSATATFTVTKPTPVVVTAAAATTVNACDYTDQAALNAAFQTWLGTASVSGGCAPVPSNGNPTAPDLCQGGTVTVTFTATDKCETQSATATFTVTKPTPVVVTAAAATTVNACDYTDQAALNAAFQTWLGTASVSGGCAPVPSNGNPTAPDLCQGGTVTVTFTATDKCETQSATATFTVTKPTPVVVTAAAATTVNACDYTDQAALNAAFQTWLGTASVSGGCAPVPSNGNPTAPDLCQGGTVTVTFTATDKCETQSATATFTVTKPTPVVVTAAAATTVNACDYTDQAALNAAFQTWLGTASVSGGCAPVPSNGNPTAPDLCQGGTVTVTFTATDKCETQSATATFTVTKPTPVVVTAAAATTVNACDYTDQAALNAAFQTWLGTASVSGGCAPVPSNGNPTAPDLCQGGTVTVTFTATDKCETQSATATFTVTKPTPVVVTAAAATTVNACDYTDQAALNAAFQTWLGTASVSGGCAPVPSNGNPTAPDLCQGGTVTVTFTATDKCETQSATATFTVTKPTPVVVTAAAATTVNACDYTDQAALNAAFQTWLGTASVSGGCAPVPSNGNPTAPDLCQGGTVTVTFTATDKCETQSATATFTVTKPTPVVVTAAAATTVNACDYTDQAALNAAFQTWLGTASVSGGCAPVPSNGNPTAPDLCQGGTVTVTFTATDKCETQSATATFTVTKPTPVVVTAAAATTVNACDYTDQAALNAAFQTWLGTASVSGGCAPVPSNGNPTAPDLCQGGTVTVTFTATDKCETQSATATFTVTKPTPVVVTAAAATTVNACDYTDQAALNAAFQTWLGTASVSGGCAPVPSNGNPTAPDLCQGGTVTVTFTATDKCETQSATATFTVTKPTPVVVTAAAATTVNACDYTDQAALNAAFQTWLGTASVSGGCAPVPSNGNPTAPDLCQGGTVTVTFTATDKCETQSATATFTVTKPTPVVVTAAAATTVNACDYTDQAALNAAFQTWLGTASVSGGCAPVPSNGNPTAPDLCQGGTVTVTFTATDKCETQSATATFTVTKPTPVVVTAAAATTVNACDYTDQAALNAAFQTWLGTASVSGGCAPVPSNGNPTAPDLCQGGTVTVTFTATDKCETQSATATFTVTKPTPVVVTAAAATTVNACDYTDQAALNAAFQTWLGTASVSGGCAPVPSNGNPTAPDLCQGGTVTVTFTATDKCETQSATATFTVTKPTPVVVTAAAATTVNACDYTDQAALNAAFQTWLGTASVSGGCAPVPSNGNPTAPDLCQGGTVTVTFTATDKCETQSATATFTVTKPTPVVVTAAAATTVNACDYTDQAALNAAFQTWLGTASVSGGCAPVPSNGNPTAPDLCQGGTVTVTFTATDKCETQSATATFTVTKPTPVVVTAAAATTVNACDYTDQAALNAAFQTWLGTASVSGGCAPVPSNGNPTAPDLCQGGTVTVTFTATDKCETQSATATFTVTKPTPVVVTAAAATTVNACDYTDQAALNAAFQTWLGTASVSGGCAPVPSNGNPTAPDLCQGGTVTVTFTATDKCETQSATATFTVTKPTPVVVTAAAATTVNACDYTDQAALNAAFQTWLGTASVSGGCAPVPSNGNPTAPDLCQGGTVTVTFTATDKCETQSATATFTVTKPTPVVVTAAAATTVNACDYTDQAALNAAFQTWLGTASVSGGCAPVPSNGNPTAPDLCQGGTVTVTFTATDKCETQSATATFTVTKPTPVVVTAAAATTVNACDYTDQAALNAAFQTWLGTASVSGGCAPVPSNGNPTAPDLCQGGTVTVTFTATDKCETQSATATFTVTKPTPVVVTCPASQTFCEVADNNYTIPELIVTNGCGKPVTVNYQITGATTRSGTGTDASGEFSIGVSTITWTVTDACGNTTTCSTTVTINPLPAPTITPSQDPVCANTGTVTYSTPQVGCNTYSWTISEGGTIIGSSTGNSIVVQWTTAGVKTVTVTETMCGTGCTKTVSKDFTVNPKPITTPITHD